MNRRRALVAAPRHPAREQGAGARCVLDLVAALQADGRDVVFCALEPEPGWQGRRRDLEQLGVEVRHGVADVRRDVEDGRFDVAALAFWRGAEPLVSLLRTRSPATAVVVHSVDVHFLRVARHAAASGGVLEPGTALDEEFRRELATYVLADRVVAVSQKEARLLGDFLNDPARCRAVPLSERDLGPVLPAGQRRGVLFVGNFRHVPNVEAAEVLCTEVLPAVDPDALRANPLTIVGNDLFRPWLHELRRKVSRFPGVRLVGPVADVAPYVRRARVSVAPLLHGAGVKGKVLESLSAGTPVVTTSLGAEGLPGDVAAAVVVAEESHAMARRLEALLDDDLHWQRRSGAGRRAVLDHHGHDAVVAGLRSVFAEALQHASGRVADGAARDAAGRRWARSYRSVRDLFPGEVARAVPEGGQVLVVSGGDDQLLRIPGRAGFHFPQDGDGRHAGFHPADGEAAVSHLGALVDRGARYLAVPSSSLYWLHRYPELHRHLRDGARRVHRGEHASVYELAPEGRTPGHVVMAAPAEVVEEARASPPSTCTVDGREWDGCAPPPLDRVGAADLVVLVRPGAVLPPGFLDHLLARAAESGLDVVQPAFEVGAPAPPAYVAQGGIVVREMGLLPGAPVLAARSGAVGALLAVIAAVGPAAEVAGHRTGVLDAVTVGLDPRAGAPGAGAAAAPLLRAVVAPLPRGRQPVLRRERAPAISVVIATHRRPRLLAACLESFVAQDIPADDFEVVVVDDGSADATHEVLAGAAGRLPLVGLAIAHAGRAAAKNLGVLAARGDLVLFFDDDDVATPSLLDVHLRAHAEHPGPELAVLGHTSWAPELRVSPLMHYLTDVGMLLFSYPKLSPGEQLDFRYFWEGRLSCKRAFLLANGLHDRRLDYTIDVELGSRLSLAGLKVVYEPEARSHMARPVTLDDFRRRCEGKGRAAVQFSRLQPHEVVREYCRVDVAAHEWAARAATHEADVARARELERLAGPDHATAPPDVLEELYARYQRVFLGDTFRAIAAAAADAATTALTVVVPVWSVTGDLADLAHRTVERIWEVASVATDVVVVDNGSPYRRDLRASSVVRWRENRGVAAAWNAGAAAGGGRFLAFVNSDVLVEPGWDAALCEAAEGRRVAFPYTDHRDGLGFRRPDKAGTAGWAFVLSRALFEELGPFDEAFAPAYFEDTDYWHRAWERGVGLDPVPAARVRHARRTTARHLPGFEELFERNRRLYERKHGLAFEAPPPYWHRAVTDHVAPGSGPVR